MIDKISDHIKEAMKAKETDRLSALRMLKSKLLENKTAKKPLQENDVLISYCKKLRDSLASFPEGSEHFKKTELELKYLAVYMPEQLTEDEVLELINKIKSSTEAPNFGAIMKALSPQIKGRFDGKKASELVKGAL